jgi:3-hydroxy acid dehydrogenase/malonic semialdehyde reductase
MQRLENRLALVTGASAGIGAATARALTAEGARCLLVARRRERLEALAAELEGAIPVVADVTDREGLERAVAAALPDGRGVDLAVLNAGLARGTEPLQAGDPGEWSEVLDTNVKGVLHGLSLVLPGMVERGAGHVVLLGSVAGRWVYPGGAVYCASKHAVRALYEGARLDAAGSGVRFTTVDPGMVETEFSEVRFRGDREKAAGVYEGFQPLAPEDVADAIRYAVTRPPHVDVGELVLWPTAQASVRDVKRDA